MIKNSILFVLVLIAVSCKTNVGSEESIPLELDKGISIKGQLENSNGLKGNINIMGYFVDPIYGGSLNEDGSFEFLLPEAFNLETKKSFDIYNSSPDAEYQLAFNTALESFPNANSLEFIGKDVKVGLPGKYYRYEVQSESETAFIYPASSENFVKYVVGTSDAIPETGYHYYYLYANEPVFIKGTLKTDNLYEDGTEEVYERSDNYEIDIKTGWNLIRYEVTSLSESSLGTQAKSKTAVFTVDLNAKILNWFSDYPKPL